MRIVRRKGASALFWHVLLLVGNCSATVALSVSSSSASATPGEENLRKTFSAPSQTKQCVIVGGGPIGLATALTLSRPPHSYAVTVLEQSAGATAVKKYDPTRSYLYNINPRGLNWFEEVAPASAIQKLSMAGYAPKNGVPLFVIVPADPEVPIPPPKPAAISGRVQLMNRTNYWIPRHQMVAALLECCREQNDLADSATGVIDVCAGKQVDSVVPADDHSLVVHCRDGSSYPASLVVAADGIDSAVWSCLADASARTWLQSHFQRFRIRRYRSPSTGLKLKALQLPPHFALPNTNGTTFQPDSTTILGIRGVNKGSRNTLSLGMLPMKDGHLIRPANTNTPYDHEIWSLQTGTQAKAWFAKNFPRLPWENLVDDVEWERFIRAKGTTFPHCQYSPGSAVASPNGMTGVVMVGDACHAFPPDIGQGINAGFQDVVALDSALRGVDIRSGKDLTTKKKPASLADALQAYQSNRGPEHKALIRLARFGAPFQYRQPWRRHRVGNLIWTANVAFRLLLNKISFGLIPPAAIVIMVQDHSLTFRQVMRRADLTALGLKLLSLAWLFRMIVKKFGLAL